MPPDAVNLAERLSQSGTLQNLPQPVQTALFLSALAFLPALLVSVTAFTRIAIVLGFVRKAVSTQDIPPTSVLIGLSLFLTLFVMGPTLDEVGKDAVLPYLDGKLDQRQAFCKGAAPFQRFMLRQTRRQDLALFVHLSGIQPPEEPANTPLRVLVPAFMISELKTAFVMGFCIYLPFLLVDLVVASVLTALGIVTLPPVIISAPFKILLFVVADGWHFIVRALSVSFG